MENEFKFINQKEIYQYKFYMIPKELFVNERYTSLSPATILLEIWFLKSAVTLLSVGIVAVPLATEVATLYETLVAPPSVTV